MSLSAHDRRALDLIEEGLAASDPGLAARLSAFNRLADGEAMPGRERIRARRQHVTGQAFRATLAVRPGKCWRQMSTRRWVVLTWLAISLVLIALALVASHAGSRASCAARAVPSCGSHLPAHQQGRPGHGAAG